MPGQLHVHVAYVGLSVGNMAICTKIPFRNITVAIFKRSVFWTSTIMRNFNGGGSASGLLPPKSTLMSELLKKLSLPHAACFLHLTCLADWNSVNDQNKRYQYRFSNTLY